jgi:hypothetical protein
MQPFLKLFINNLFLTFFLKLLINLLNELFLKIRAVKEDTKIKITKNISYRYEKRSINK